MKPVKDNPYHIQAVERTLLLLNCFTAEKFEWTLTELSEAIGVNKSTVFRILTTLQTYQYLKLGEDGFYRLGTQISLLSAIDTQTSDMKSTSMPIMQKLHDDYNETVILTHYLNNQGFCIAKIESQNPLKITSTVGTDTRLFRGATGKVIAAYLSEAEYEKALSVQEALYEDHYHREYTKRTMERIRKDGYSISSNEVDMGVCALAGPIFDYQGKIVGSLSIAGPNFRFQPQNNEDVIQAIIESSEAVSRGLGFSGDGLFK